MRKESRVSMYVLHRMLKPLVEDNRGWKRTDLANAANVNYITLQRNLEYMLTRGWISTRSDDEGNQLVRVTNIGLFAYSNLDDLISKQNREGSIDIHQEIDPDANESLSKPTKKSNAHDNNVPLKSLAIFISISLLFTPLFATGASVDRFQGGIPEVIAGLSDPDRSVIVNISIPAECYILNAMMNVACVGEEGIYPVAPELLLNDTLLWAFNPVSDSI